ncbi:MAG: hypothetical protein JWM53_630, partial [bacterium]|nr:hypothetical protein [bacterium]
ATLFVGPGELAAPSPGTVPAAPSRARASLPLLGRVQPAHQEVSASAAKRTGTALREIFPDLLGRSDE